MAKGEWVTDPDALYTIIALHALRPGDEIKERSNPNNGMHAPHTEYVGRAVDEGHARHIEEYYARGVQGTHWTLVAWRRPNGKS